MLSAVLNKLWAIVSKFAIEPTKLIGMVTKEKFIELTEKVIDNLEGGYYHPLMKIRMSKRDAAIMGDSGETMFGIDRKHGAQLSKYNDWKEFWRLIDEDRKKQPALWKHYYRGGKLEPQLKQLAASMMYQWFTVLSKKYLNEAAINAIAADPRLIIHFSYASWNGEGWFKRFATSLNSAIKNNAPDIFAAAFSARKNSINPVIRQQAANMERLF
jgi:hypothetical protein